MATLDLVLNARNKSQAAISEAEGQMDSLKNKTKDLQSTMQDMGKGLTDAGTKMTAGLTLPIVGLGTVAVEAALKEEKLEASFTTLTGSATKAKQVLGQLADFAANTPFTVDQVENAGNILLKYGVKADDVAKDLHTLGEIATGANIPIEQMSAIFGRAEQAGGVYTNTLMQMQKKGIPVVEALAKSMGISEEAVKKLAKTGQISIPQLQTALDMMASSGGKFANAMENQNKTIPVLLQNFHDSITVILQDLGEQILKTFDVQGKMQGLLEWMNGLRQRFTELLQTNPALVRMGIIIAAIVAAIGPLLVGLGWLVGILANLAPLFGAVGAAVGLLLSPWGLLVAGIGALVYFNFDKIKDLGTKILPALKGAATSAAESFQLLMGAVGRFASSTSVQTAIQGIEGSFSKIKTAIAQLFTGNIGIGEFAEKIKDAVSGIPALLKNVFTGGDFAALKTQIMSALGLNNISFDKLTESFKTFGQKVADTVNNFDYSGAFGTLKTTVGDAISKIDWQGGLTTVKDKLTGIRDGLLVAATDKINSIDWSKGSLSFAGFINWVADKIRSIDWKSINVGDIGKALVAVVMPEISAAFAGISWVMDSTKWAGLVSAVKTAFTSIEWGKLEGAFGNLLSAVRDGIASMNWSGVSEPIAKISGVITEKIKALEDSVKSFSLAGAIETLKGQANTFRDDIIGKIATAIKGLDLTAMITNFLNTLKTAVEGIDFKSIGSSVGSALSAALSADNLKAGLATAVATVAPALIAAIAGISWIMDSKNFSSLASAIMTSIEGIDWSAVGTAFSSLVTAIKGALGDLASGFTGSFTAPQWVTDFINWKFPTVPEAIGSLVKWAWPKVSPDVSAFIKWVWPSLPESIQNWLKWVWPQVPAIITALMAWGWPAVPTIITTLTGWKWPQLPEILQKILDWKWPALKMPGWVSKFLGVSDDDTGHALGTSSSEGGWKMVGERGKELMYIPKGTQVFNNRDTSDMLSEGMGGGSINLTVYATINNSSDEKQLINTIIDEINRRRSQR